MCEYPHVVVTGASSGAGLVNDAGTDGFGPRPAVSVTGELDVIRAFVTRGRPDTRHAPFGAQEVLLVLLLGSRM